MAPWLLGVGRVWQCLAWFMGRGLPASMPAESGEKNRQAGLAESARAASLVPRVQLRFAVHCSWSDCDSAFVIPQRTTRYFSEGCRLSAVDACTGLGCWILLLGMDR